MPTITATFRSNYSESRKWVIVDAGRDPNAPPVIFDGYLEPDQTTAAISIYSADGVYGVVNYQRSDGPIQVVDDVTDGADVRMD